MAASLNKVILIGHLGKDPETRYTTSGDAVCNISLATSESWKDKNTGEKREATEWHRLACYGKLAEIAQQYLQKGSLIYVEGRIKTNKYTDNQGQEKYSTQIIIGELKMLGGKSSESGNNGPGQHQQEKQDGYMPAPDRKAAGKPSFDDLGDDIPF